MKSEIIRRALIQKWILFLGCFNERISFCLAIATCVYICVVIIELCPSIWRLERVSVLLK